MTIKRLPLTFRRESYGVVHAVYGVVLRMQLDWQVRFTRYGSVPMLRVISMVCNVGDETYVLPDNLTALSVALNCTCTIEDVLDYMSFGASVRGRFVDLNPGYDAMGEFGYLSDMFAETQNPDGTRVLPCGVGPPLPILGARDSLYVVEAVAKYQRLVPEEWEVDGYYDEGQLGDSFWMEPLPCPFVHVGRGEHRGISRFWVNDGEDTSLHLDVHHCTGFYEHVEIEGFTFRICRRMAFMANTCEVAGKVAEWARRYEMDVTVLDRAWCRHTGRVWCIFAPRRCRVDDFLTSFRAYLITRLGSHDMSALNEWEWGSVLLRSHGPCAYNLGRGLHHLMNVTRYHPEARADDRALLRSGPARELMRRLWDGYVAWGSGQTAATMRRNQGSDSKGGDFS